MAVSGSIVGPLEEGDEERGYGQKNNGVGEESELEDANEGGDDSNDGQDGKEVRDAGSPTEGLGGTEGEADLVDAENEDQRG